MSEADIFQGYLDGRDLDSPEPSGNRSASYTHGFFNGRDDRKGKPRAPARLLRLEAELAIAIDAGKVTG
jgi:hypothetical protein